MGLSKIIKQKNKWLLPLSWLYKAGVVIHHKLYDFKIKKSTSFQFPLICVGNLAVGGTGKSPMTEYLIRLLKDKYRVATISRGYKRQGKGFFIADESTTVADIGDEPMQFFQKFPDISVSVCANRVEGVRALLSQKPDTEVIVLDDAFQHRAIVAGLNILLTAYDNPFYQDYCLPAGELRDIKANYKRADIIVVTKCPESLSVTEREEMIKDIHPLPGQSVFFAMMDYGQPYVMQGKGVADLAQTDEVFLMSGIANPHPLINYLKQKGKIVHEFIYPDHHGFTAQDVSGVVTAFRQCKSGKAVIMTTEKDAVKLTTLPHAWKDIPVYVMPVGHRFLFGQGKDFDESVLNYIRIYHK
ncbi:MAG: tetraacyldisaccharide 4'-kinase [Niabella sp.]